MGFIKSQLLKVIEWQDNSPDIMAYRFPMQAKHEIMMGSMLTVRESQVAILVNNGRIADVFEPGKYKLETSNMPILTKLMSWKYGFNSPFKAEVYFINTRQYIDQKWGTSNPMMMRDKEFGMVRFRAFGTFSFKVGEPVVFLKEVFGTSEMCKRDYVIGQLRSAVVSGLTEAVAEAQIPALDLATQFSELSELTTEKNSPRFEKIGLKLCSMVVENISLDEEMEKAISQRGRMNILGNAGEYTAYAAADSMKDMAKNAHLGGGSGANMGMGLGTGFAMANMYANTFNQSMNDSRADMQRKNDAVAQERREKEAAAAAKSAPVICPSCRRENDNSSKFCMECGEKLNQAEYCPECGKELKKGAKFCPECGFKFVADKSLCAKCGEKNPDGAKFCQGCGSKL